MVKPKNFEPFRTGKPLDPRTATTEDWQYTRKGIDPVAGGPLNFPKLRRRPVMHAEYLDEYREWDAQAAREDRDRRIEGNVNKLRAHLTYPGPWGTGLGPGLGPGALRTSYGRDYPGWDASNRRGLIRNIKPTKTAGQPFATRSSYQDGYPGHKAVKDDRLANNTNLQRKYMDPYNTMPFGGLAGEGLVTSKDDYKDWGYQKAKIFRGEKDSKQPSQPFMYKSLYQDSFVPYDPSASAANAPKTRRNRAGAGGELGLGSNIRLRNGLTGDTIYRWSYCDDESVAQRPDFAGQYHTEMLKSMDAKTMKGHQQPKSGPYAKGSEFWGETEYQGEILRMADIMPAYLSATVKDREMHKTDVRLAPATPAEFAALEETLKAAHG